MHSTQIYIYMHINSGNLTDTCMYRQRCSCTVTHINMHTLINAFIQGYVYITHTTYHACVHSRCTNTYEDTHSPKHTHAYTHSKVIHMCWLSQSYNHKNTFVHWLYSVDSEESELWWVQLVYEVKMLIMVGMWDCKSSHILIILSAIKI